MVNELQQRASASDDQRSYAQTCEHRAEISRAAAFKKRFEGLLMREMIQWPQLLHKIKHQKGEVSENFSATVGTNKSPVLLNGNVTGSNAILTLYGSAPQPKQLFSSLQQAADKDSKRSTLKANTRIPGPHLVSTVISSPHNESIKEHTLPNGISVTKVIPVHSNNNGKKTKVPTLGELFAPPPSLPPLNPPKHLRYNASRSSSVAWHGAPEPSASSKPNRRDTFSVQPQSTCTWLRYNSSTQLSSPEAKRKERERALSVNEPPSATAHEDTLAKNQAKEEALFRSVYSSFAPDRDNTGALITDYTKNRMWWKREGESRFQDHLETEYMQLNGENVDQNGDTAEPIDFIEEDLFKGIADDWTPKELPPEFKDGSDIVHLEIPEDSKEVDEILQEISDLLETLNSYQRNRNLSLANGARTSPQLGFTSGSPTSPSSSEVEVFTLLQSQLALMVATLPPFALAKLDGEKLGVLNVKTMVRIQDKQYKGTMEEDEVVKPKQAPMTPVVGYPPRNINPALSVPARSSAYVHPTSTPSQSIQRPNYATQPRPGVGPAASYLPNQQYSSRPTSTNPHFPGPAYSTPRTGPMASERYSYSASQHYSQRIPQTPQTQPNGYRSYSTMNGPSYSAQFPIAQQGASAASFQGQRPTQPGYQQRAMNSQSYVTGSTPAVRSASPPKPAAPFTPQQGPVIAMGNQQRPPTYHQHSGQYGSQTPLPRQVNGSSATPSSSQQPHMTAEEQSALMNRQKAQLAEQQTSAAKQGTGGTPAANGPYGGQRNGTPIVQPNGVTTAQAQ